MPIPILIDCDPGHDDAIALLLAIASPEVRVLGVTTVGGNAGVAATTRNALQILELAGADVPVAAGAAEPLTRRLEVADHVHGASGMDGPVLPPPRSTPLGDDAVAFLARTIAASPEPITLVATGPLTNLAHLLDRHPEVTARVARVVLMGGGMAESNITPAAEFNIWADPEAAAAVFGADWEVTMVGLDVTHRALLAADDIDRTAGRCAEVVAELLDFFGHFHREVYGMSASPIHDAVAVAHVIWPDLLTTELLNVEIETGSELCRGRTVVDVHRVTDRTPATHVATDIDGTTFAERLLERLHRLP